VEGHLANEGFATYAEWLWGASRGLTTPQDEFDRVMAIPADDPFWQGVVGDPGAQDLFADATYDRGGATLHALRQTIGDKKFFMLLNKWTTENKGGNVTTADFIALAEQVNGQPLDDFFQTWLYTPSKPSS